MEKRRKNPLKKTISDIQHWQNQRVLVRVDFNVPLNESGKITDDTRIREALPTLRYLLEHGARVVLASHLGRPKGQVTESLRLTPVFLRLKELLPNASIQKTDEVFSAAVSKTANNLKPGEILLLENVRFEPGEEKNDPDFARNLASLADVYVNDAFGAAHRAHASTEGVGHYLATRVAGFLMAKEIEALSGILENPQHPYTAIIGGSKVSTKITVLKNLMSKVDNLVIGGAMIFTFLKAQGYAVGESKIETDYLETAHELLTLAAEQNTTLILPQQVVIADAFSSNANIRTTTVDQIEEGWMGLDIGPESVAHIRQIISASKTILWNGPLGVFEMEPFSHGTRDIALALAECTERGTCQSILGGGDTVAALEQFHIAPERFSHVSTGGGASLEFLEGKTLPGIAILEDALPAKV